MTYIYVTVCMKLHLSSLDVRIAHVHGVGVAVHDHGRFVRVTADENHVLHPMLPERNDHGYELRRQRHERGLFLRPTMLSAILYTDSYINVGLGTNFSTSQLSIV